MAWFLLLVERKVVAISPNDKNYMYVTTTAGGSLKGVFASINGGQNWSRIANDSQGGMNPFFSPFGGNSQGWYDNALTVVPNQPGSVILGGIEMYRWILGWINRTQCNGWMESNQQQFWFP